MPQENNLAGINVDHVRSLLTEDVKFIADEGGKAQAFRHPVQTREHVARVLLDRIRSLRSNSQLNGETGIIIRSGDKIIAAIFIQLWLTVVHDNKTTKNIQTKKPC